MSRLAALSCADLFQADDGGWLQDVGLLDRLVGLNHSHSIVPGGFEVTS
jgi:hypothetical protein